MGTGERIKICVCVALQVGTVALIGTFRISRIAIF